MLSRISKIVLVVTLFGVLGCSAPSPVPPVPASIYIVSSIVPTGIIGVNYTGEVFFSGGTAPYVCSVSEGALPTGLKVQTGIDACEIVGIPTTLGVYDFTIEVTDSSTPTAAAKISIHSKI
jgi:hypothetical protein